jgi:hypothetical protein
MALRMWGIGFPPRAIPRQVVFPFLVGRASVEIYFELLRGIRTLLSHDCTPTTKMLQPLYRVLYILNLGHVSNAKVLW